MKVTCQHTGLQFEAKSARSKNHPEFAKLMTEANKESVYGQFLDAVKANRDGITIEECAELLAQCVAVKRGEQKTVWLERRAARRAYSEARQTWKPSADHLGNEDARSDIEEAAEFAARLDARAANLVIVTFHRNHSMTFGSGIDARAANLVIVTE